MQLPAGHMNGAAGNSRQEKQEGTAGGSAGAVVHRTRNLVCDTQVQPDPAQLPLLHLFGVVRKGYPNMVPDAPPKLILPGPAAISSLPWRNLAIHRSLSVGGSSGF
jgi:hypothetical protein